MENSYGWKMKNGRERSGGGDSVTEIVDKYVHLGLNIGICMGKQERVCRATGLRSMIYWLWKEGYMLYRRLWYGSDAVRDCSNGS